MLLKRFVIFIIPIIIVLFTFFNPLAFNICVFIKIIFRIITVHNIASYSCLVYYAINLNLCFLLMPIV